MPPSRSHPPVAPGLLLLALAAMPGCGDADPSPDPETHRSGSTPGTRRAGAADDVPGPADRSVLSDELLAAIDEARAAVTAAPDDAGAWLTLGMVLDANGLDDPAERTYAEATRLDPADPRAPYHRARVLARLGRTDEALAALDAALERAPDHAPGWWRRGRWLLDDGRLDEADRAFDRATGLDPTDLGGALGRARVALARDDTAAALTLLRPLAERHPGLGEVRYLLGTALRQSGDLAAAAAELAHWDGEPAPLFDPWEGEVARHLAGYQAVMDQVVALGMSGEAREAVAPLEAMHRAAPDDSAVLEKLVAAYLDTGRTDDARGVTAAALQRDDGHYRTWFALALVEERAGRVPEATDAARRSLDLHPTWARGHELLARLRWRSGDLAGAADALADAIAYGSDDAVNLIKRARALALLQRWPEALADLERAAAGAPPSAELSALLAEARAESGDLAGAWADFERAASIERDHAQVRRVLARLVQLDPRRAAAGGETGGRDG